MHTLKVMTFFTNLRTSNFELHYIKFDCIEYYQTLPIEGGGKKTEKWINGVL